MQFLVALLLCDWFITVKTARRLTNHCSGKDKGYMSFQRIDSLSLKERFENSCLTYGLMLPEIMNANHADRP